MPPTYRTVALSTTPRLICKSDKRRTSITFVSQDPANTIYIHAGRNPAVGDGLPLYPLEEIFMNKGLGDQTNVNWYAHSGAGTPNISIMEQFGDELV